MVESFDLDALAQAADGFSGAEIEQVVVSGLYEAHASSRPLDTEILQREIANTRPLSTTMARADPGAARLGAGPHRAGELN